MKKIITLFIAVASFAAVHAQSSRDEARKVVLGQPKRTTSTQQGRNVILGTPGQNTTIYKTNRTSGNDHYGRKTNPGRHLGWYKGVGNPHRYGMQPGNAKKWDHDGDDDHGRKKGHGRHDD